MINVCTWALKGTRHQPSLSCVIIYRWSLVVSSPGNIDERNSQVKKISALLLVAVAVIVALAVVAGCGGGTGTSAGAADPQAAVKAFLKGVSTGSWDAYSSSILPSDLKALPAENLDQLKKQLASSASKTSFTGITMKSEINPKDKTQALVTMTGGTIATPATTSTPAQNQKVSDLPESDRVVYTREYKGHWYVDMGAMSQLQQQQQQQSTTPSAPSSTPATPTP